TVVSPLLSMVCHELNERRKQANREKIDLDLLELANPERILENFYESCLLEVPPPVRRFVEDRLVSPTGFREAVSLDSARAELQHQKIPQPDEILFRLIERRLLSVFDEGGVRRIELVNDLLTG